MRSPGNARKGDETTEHLDDDLIFKFINGLVDEKEQQTVYEHLSFCHDCSNEVAAIIKFALHGPAPEEELALQRCIEEKTLQPNHDWWRRFISILLPVAMRRRHRIPVWRLGFAFVAVFALMSGSYVGISYYNTSSRLQQAERLLKNNYRVFFEETPRLAGGYETKGIGVLMGEEDSTSYLKQASSLAEAAFKSGWKSDEAKQLLAKVFIINQDYDKADSIFNLIKTDAAKSATALNDLGVLNYQKKNWEIAASYFAAAIQADPQLKEARYNLALAKAKLGAINEAIAILDEYLKLETDDGWKAAAEEFQKKLKAERS